MVDEGAATEELAERLFAAGVGTAELINIYLGDQLGLYRALAAQPGATAAELATSTGVERRYLREWLQGQVVSGFLMIDGTDLDTAAYTLAPGAVAVLVDELSPAYLAPLGQLFAALGPVLPELLAAYRTGAGVPYAAYGPGAVAAQGALNRPAFAGSLVAEWLPQLPTVLARLADTSQPARVADVGCGVGWSTIALAEGFPHLRVSGFDLDETSIAQARRNAQAYGVADRVHFAARDIADNDDGYLFDVAFLFECLHDMAYPERVLATVGRALAPGGQLVVMDERTDDELVPGSADPVQRFFAAVSPLWCLPQGRPDAGAHPVGTVMRAADLRALAAEAGFTEVEVAPIEDAFFRFYRLSGWREPATR